jgi:hypothetical protein
MLKNEMLSLCPIPRQSGAGLILSQSHWHTSFHVVRNFQERFQAVTQPGILGNEVIVRVDALDSRSDGCADTFKRSASAFSILAGAQNRKPGRIVDDGAGDDRKRFWNRGKRGRLVFGKD